MLRNLISSLGGSNGKRLNSGGSAAWEYYQIEFEKV